MVGWHHRFNVHESEQTLGDGEGQGCLSMGLQRVGHDWWTEQKQQWALKVRLRNSYVPQSTRLMLLLLSCFSRVQLCTPIDGSPPDSPVPGFSRQEHWSGLPFPSPVHEVKSESEVAQSCPTLRDPMDCSLPGSSIQGIFQARVLEWVAISFSNACMHARSLHAVDGTLSNLYIGAQCWFECEYLFVEHFNIKGGFLVVVLFPLLLSTDSFRVFFLFFVQ